MRTLYQLKQLIEVAPAPSEQKVPSAISLIKSGSRLMDFVIVGQDRIYVFENGYVLYLTPDGPTVIPLHFACRGYKYDVNECDKVLGINDWQLSEACFDTMPWPVRVIIAAEDRIEHNKATRTLSRNTVSYDTFDWEIEALADFRFNGLSVIEYKELIDLMVKGFKAATSDQREVVIECIITLRSLTDIAAERGRSVPTIAEMRDNGLNNIRRVFNNNGYSIELKKCKKKRRKGSSNSAAQ